MSSTIGYPRVSQVLAHLWPNAFDHVSYKTLKEAQMRGTYYHGLAAELSLSWQFPEAHPFTAKKYAKEYHIVNSLKEWRKLYSIKPLAIEQKDINPTYRYAGTPDLLCMMDFAGKEFQALIDYKFTAAVMPANYVQISAYWHLPKFKNAKRAFILNINPKTGEKRMYEVYRYGGSYWPRFIQGLKEVHNLQ